MKLFSGLIISLLIFSHSVLSQSNDQTQVYEVGQPYPVIDARDKSYFSEDDELMTVKITGKTVYIQKFNLNTLSYIGEQSYEDFPEKFEPELIEQIKGKYYYFYSWTDLKAKHEKLYVREIDFKRGQFVGDALLLLDIDKKILGSKFWKTEDYVKFHFNFSFSRSRIAIRYYRKPEIKDDSKSFNIMTVCLFDSALKELSVQDITMPFTEKKMDNLDAGIDNDGNLFILARVFNDDTRNKATSKKDDKPNYHLETMKVAAGTNTIVQREIEMDGKYLTQVKIYGNDDKMYCAGYYSKHYYSNAADGVFTMQLSREGVLESKNFYEIPTEILNMYASKKEVKHNEKEDQDNDADFDALKLDTWFMAENGSIVLVGEQIWVETRRSSSSKAVTYIYHYDDILVTKIAPDGKLAWMRKLPKRQMAGLGAPGMSFYYHFNEKIGSHYMIYIDNEKNKTLSIDEKPAPFVGGWGGGYLASYSVNDNSGLVSKSYFFDMKNVNGMPVSQLYVNRIVGTDDGNYIVEVYKKDKQDILIRLFAK